jgi:hypothetical protein
MMLHMKTTLYALVDPRTGLVRYIGKTSKAPEERLHYHIKGSKHKRCHREKWISMLIEMGLQPQLQIIDVVEGNGSQAEMDLIKKYREMGCDLTNATDGGDGSPGYKHTEESRAKIREKRKNQKFSKESIEKRAASLRGRPRSTEARQAISAGHRLRTHCKNGHSVEFATITYTKKGHLQRSCRECSKERGRRKRASIKLAKMES